jgi:hypothetical protein
MLLLFSFTIFLSAALLFLVQPMVAKMILPLLGGTPAVWNTCMVFFQMVLLLGYAYSHAAPRWLGVRRHALAHVALIALPLLVLPIRVSGWLPPGTEFPAAWLLTLLLAVVGLPFFALSTNAPLLQRWFASTRHRAAADPYFLYGASNLGSMLALLGYPLVVEPHLRLATQARVWMLGYVVLLAMIAICVALVWRAHPKPGENESAESATEPDAPAPSTSRRLRWVALAFVPSSLMLGVTSYITTDVAAVPLLWVIPLALYLLSFIIVFARPPLWVHRAMMIALPLVLVRLALLKFSRVQPEIGEIVVIHLVAFFAAAMVCHGELAMSRPRSSHLTEFYLWMSFGGMLGGLFNALVAPRVFDRVVEYPLAFVLVFLLRPHWGARVTEAVPSPTTAAPRRSRGKSPRPEPVARSGRRSTWATVGWLAFALILSAAFFAQSVGGDPRVFLYSARNFFGVCRVKMGPFPGLISMFHGTTVHGIQSTQPERRGDPLSYFHRAGPAGQIFAALEGTGRTNRVAVCGLGIGTLLGYAHPGESWTYYEIDPAVERLARDARFFTYVRDAEARGVRLRVVLGDARIQLARAPEKYGLIILDAFTSDAIPVHLITREAFRVYLDKLADDGVIMVNVSSRYFRLPPVLADLGADARLTTIYQDYEAVTLADLEQGRAASQWIVMARRPESLRGLIDDSRWQRLASEPGRRVWSDDFSNVLSVMIWGGGP